MEAFAGGNVRHRGDPYKITTCWENNQTVEGSDPRNWRRAGQSSFKLRKILNSPARKPERRDYRLRLNRNPRADAFDRQILGSTLPTAARKREGCRD